MWMNVMEYKAKKKIRIFFIFVWKFQIENNGIVLGIRPFSFRQQQISFWQDHFFLMFNSIFLCFQMLTNMIMLYKHHQWWFPIYDMILMYLFPHNILFKFSTFFWVIFFFLHHDQLINRISLCQVLFNFSSLFLNFLT